MLEKLKEYLNISYDDAATDNMLNSAIERGKKILDDYAGNKLNYEEEGLPRQLLFDYCRYVRSHAAEMFEQNFRHDLIALREMTEAANYANKEQDTVSDVQ